MKNLDLARNKISNKAGHRPSKRFSLPLLPMITGFFMIAIIAFMAIYFQKAGDETANDKIQEINIKLAQIDDRLTRIENTEKSISLIDEQRTKFEISLMNRIEGLEALITLRQEADSEIPDTLHREATTEKAIPEEVSKKESVKEPDANFHHVQPGETLYRISLKYNIAVDELRELNNIGPEAIIYIGQRLKVSGNKE